MNKSCPPAARRALTESDVLLNIIDFLPSGVTLFDAELEMITCNRLFRELLEFPDALFENALPSMADLALFNAERGEYGPGDPVAIAEAVVARAKLRQAHVFERHRPNGRILEIRGTALPDGGFVSIYTDITDRKRAEDEARRSASYLHAVMNTLPQGISVIDEDLNLVFWNPAFKSVLKLPEGFLKPGVTFADVARFNAERGEYGQVDPESKVAQMVELARRFEPHRFERNRGDGGVVEVEGRIVEHEGQVLGFVTTYNDITERVSGERTIRRVSDLMTDAIEFSPTYIWETDCEGRYTFVQGAEKILGHADRSLLGQYRWSTLHDSHAGAAAMTAELEAAMREHRPIERCTVSIRHRNGGTVWISCSARPVLDAGGVYVGYRGVDVDVTELTIAQQELEQMALHDPLTGLANRHKFMTRYELEVARQTRSGETLVLLQIDIDRFKSINDRFGHHAGDECLRAVANTLSSNVRAVDLVARFGGEEFVVLLSNTTAAEALVVADKLRRAVAATRLEGADAGARGITISIGVAAREPADPRDFDGVFAQADAGMYAAKHAGRNCVRVGDWDASTSA